MFVDTIDAAREIGTFMLKTKGAQPQEIAGKYVVIWQKVGSDWKLATDIWNHQLVLWHSDYDFLAGWSRVAPGLG